MKLLCTSAIALASLLLTPAFAADFGTAATPATYSSATQNWTGFYAGIFGGVAAGDFDYSLVPTGGPSVLDLNVNGGGGLAGVAVGFDYQIDQFVIGAVADIAITNHAAEIGFGIPGLGAGELNSTLQYLGTVRARGGVAFDNLLAYAHGGLAFGGTRQELTVGGAAVPGFDPENPNRLGYTIGAGVEYKVSETISLQTEYAYTSFGDEDVYLIPGGSVTESLAFHSVKAGVNFRF